MDQWRKKSITDEQIRQRTVNPSFSSTLLDSIYRSIDEGEEHRGFHREIMKKKQSVGNNLLMENRERLDKWMMLEKNRENRRKSVPGFDRRVVVSKDRSSMFIHSTSSSSDSSSGGGFSSSEAESVKSRSSSVPIQRPKPIRTERNESHHHHLQHEQQQKSKKQENGFVRTKSKALKIYGDLKKVKQPISPGGRLATFINSLFHAKKQGKSSSNSVNREDFRSEMKSKSTETSTCSSASSFSRSCLSKAPSTNGKSSKRTVRFYPVTVIVDEDSRPCGEKSVYGEAKNPNPNPNLIISIDEREKKQKMIQEAARDLIANYRKNNEFNSRDSLHKDEDDDDDEDAASYASSDLFELENLASIGIEDRRYSEELPVYETTHFPMNRAIANGFIL